MKKLYLIGLVLILSYMTTGISYAQADSIIVIKDYSCYYYGADGYVYRDSINFYAKLKDSIVIKKQTFITIIGFPKSGWSGGRGLRYTIQPPSTTYPCSIFTVVEMKRNK